MAKSPSSRQQAARQTPPNLATPQSRHLSRRKNRTPRGQRRLLRVATKAALESRWQSRVLEAGNHRPSTRMAPLCWGIPPGHWSDGREHRRNPPSGVAVDGSMGRNWTTLLDPRPGLSRESIAPSSPIVVTLRSRLAQESGSKNRRHKDGRSSCQGCIFGWLDKEGTMNHGKGTGTGCRTFS